MQNVLFLRRLPFILHTKGVYSKDYLTLLNNSHKAAELDFIVKELIMVADTQN
jgi:hypothetical protein